MQKVELDDLDEEKEIEYMIDNSNKANLASERLGRKQLIKDTMQNQNNLDNSKILVVNSVNNSTISKRLTEIFISECGSVLDLEEAVRFKPKPWEIDSLENGFSGNKENKMNFSNLNLEGKHPSTQKRVRKKYKKSEIYENEYAKIQEAQCGQVGNDAPRLNFLDILESNNTHSIKN